MRLMGEAQGVAYREQVNALGSQGVALIEVLKSSARKACASRRISWLQVAQVIVVAPAVASARCCCSIYFAIR